MDEAFRWTDPDNGMELIVENDGTLVTITIPQGYDKAHIFNGPEHWRLTLPAAFVADYGMEF